MDKDVKKELTLWVIIGIIVGLFILFMPDIERFIFGRAKKDKTEVKKEEKQEQTGVLKTGTINCGVTKDGESIEYAIYYENNKAVKETMTTLTIFNKEKDITTDIKSECSNLSSKYNGQTGFTATCNLEGLTMTKKYVMNLRTYKGFTLTNTDGSTETFTKDIEYGQDIEDVVEKLELAGAVCK